MGSTDRIAVFGPRPYFDAVAHLRATDHCNPAKLLIPGKPPVFQPIFYCGFCNKYATSHDHVCHSPQGPFDGYPCKYTCHKIDRMKVGTIEFHLKSKDTLVSN